MMIAIAFLSLNIMAQAPQQSKKRAAKKEQFKNMSAEDLAEIQTKKIVLRLDLDDKQTDQVYNLVLEKTKARKAKMEANKGKKREDLTSEEKTKLMNERLDAQIAFKKEMKSILSKEQYEKFEKAYSKGNKKRKKKSRRQS